MIQMPGDNLEKKLIDDLINESKIKQSKPKLRDKFKMACQLLINKFKTAKR